MKKSYKTTLSIFIVIVLVGLSYAWFRTNADNTQRQEVNVTAGIVRLSYTDCTGASCNNISASLEPGETVEKTFKVENTGSTDTVFNLYFSSLYNPFLQDELVYTLEDITDSTIVKTNSPVPYQSSETSNILLQSDMSIAVNETKEYKLTVKFVNKDTDQSYNAHKQFSMRLGITTD